VSTNQSVLVLGVGRSGTTAIYSLLQNILESIFPGDVDFVYEPFLWDRKTFNRFYSDVKDEFTLVSSISVEGIYHHKQLPILVNENSIVSEHSKDWLRRTLTPADGKSHYLGKMIRANGRIRLIRELVPTTKIIVLTRNPLDVLNSASQLFSLYGTQFHESDYKRFFAEVQTLFQINSNSIANELSDIDAEFRYWYFSNRVLLEYAKSHPSNFLSISYEAYVENRQELAKRICDFIGVEFNSSFLLAAGRVVGAVKHDTPALTRNEYEYLLSKVDTYKELLNFVDCKPKMPIESFIKTSSWSEVIVAPENSPCFNGFHAGRELRRMEINLAQVSSELTAILASKPYRMLTRLLAPYNWIKRLKPSKKFREFDR